MRKTGYPSLGSAYTPNYLFGKKNYVPNVQPPPPPNKCTYPANTLYGYPLINFSYMPPTTNKQLIIECMNQVAVDLLSQGICVEFSSPGTNCIGLPYMEILLPDNSGNYIVYSSTNSSGYLFTTDSSYIIVTYPNAFLNQKRFYMWNTTIKYVSIQPTEEFPATYNFEFSNGSSTTIQQKMSLIASTPIQSNPPYTVTQVNRNTIYVYYPNTVIYCLVNTTQQKVFVMQTGNNQQTNTTPLTPYNMSYLGDLLISNTEYPLPQGYLFLTCQLSDSDTIVVYSSPSNPAKLIQDALSNSYQYAEPKYANCLYQNFT